MDESSESCLSLEKGGSWSVRMRPDLSFDVSLTVSLSSTEAAMSESSLRETLMRKTRLLLRLIPGIELRPSSTHSCTELEMRNLARSFGEAVERALRSAEDS